MNNNNSSTSDKDPVKIAVFALLVFVGFVSYVRIWDSDVLWHLKSGQVMSDNISNQKGLPDKDIFSHTNFGEKWINDEWLGDLYLYGAYKKSGFKGVQRLAVAISIFICIILYFASRGIGGDPVLIVPLLGVAFLASRVRLTNHRPEMFFLLFAVAIYFLINRILLYGEEERGNNQQRSYVAFLIIPFIQVIWVNFHPSAILAIVFIFLSIICSIAAFLLRLKTRYSIGPYVDSKTLKGLGLIFVISIALSLCNPYGIHSLMSPFKFADNALFINNIAEWAPIPIERYFMLQGAPGRLAIPFFIIIGMVSFALNIKRINLFHLSIFIITAVMALKSRRFIAIFCLLSAPIIAANLSFLFMKYLSLKNLRVALTILLIVGFAVIVKYDVVESKRFIWGEGIKDVTSQASVIKFIKDNKFNPEIFNSYSSGGALIWGLNPEYRVFIDGRTTFYGAEFIRNFSYLELHPSDTLWESYVSKYNLNIAVLKTNDSKPLIDYLLKDDHDWTLVFWDQYSAIFIKDIEEHRDTIDKYRYRMTDPFNCLDIAYKWKNYDDSDKAALLGELWKNLGSSPDNIIAIRALAYIMNMEKEYDKALELVDRGIKIRKDIAGLHAIRGEIMLTRGNISEAVRAFRTAAKIVPEYNEIVKKIENGINND